MSGADAQPGRRHLVCAFLLAAFVPVVPWAVLFAALVLAGNPDGAAGWCALGVVVVPFGAVGGLIVALAAQRGRPGVGAIAGGVVALALFAGLFASEPLGFLLFNAVGLALGMAAAFLAARQPTPKLSSS